MNVNIHHYTENVCLCFKTQTSISNGDAYVHITQVYVIIIEIYNYVPYFVIHSLRNKNYLILLILQSLLKNHNLILMSSSCLTHIKPLRASPW